MIRLVVALSSLSVATLAVGPWCMAFGPLRWTRGVDVIFRSYARLVLRVTGARLLPPVWHTAPERLPERLIIVSNHESLLDPPAIVLALGTRSVRFIVKREVFKLPVFGWSLWAAGCVGVCRVNSQRDRSRLAADTRLSRDSDVLFFAEGTRSRTGALAPFKSGAFAMALQRDLPILPMAIGGTYECLPPTTLQPTPGNIAVVFGEPIPVVGLRLQDKDGLRQRVHARVAELRQEALTLAGSPRAQHRQAARAASA